MMSDPKNKGILRSSILKVGVTKVHFLHDQSSSWGVMDILSFHEDTNKPVRCYKMPKTFYLRQMTYNPIIFSSTALIFLFRGHYKLT